MPEYACKLQGGVMGSCQGICQSYWPVDRDQQEGSEVYES